VSPLGSLLGRRSKLSTEQRHRLLLRAVQLHADGVRVNELEKGLEELGASADEAREICAQARRRFEEQLTREVPLPASAHAGANYYFILGVTPRATTDQIRRAYRTKAKELHPDRHNGEFSPEAWTRLMSVAADAHRVLTDPRLRRAYDVVWLRRSHEVGTAAATRAERRGDWVTRYLWYMAEIAELDERLLTELDQLVADPAGAATMQTIALTTDDYEDRILTVRLQTYSLPDRHAALVDAVRSELTRKHRVVQQLRQLVTAFPGSGRLADQVAAITAGLRDLRAAHHRFDVRVLRDGLSPAGNARGARA
jgi:curved DNA-binding protein CbpA